MDMSGYDVPFTAELDPRFTCPVCLHVQRDAVQTTCGHRFCNTCITIVKEKQITRTGRANSAFPCPVDKTDIKPNEIFPDVATQREILSLPVRCTNHEDGCYWRGELRHIESHTDVCPMERVSCPGGCPVKAKRTELEDHVMQCPLRQIPCPFCSGLVVHDILESHKEECPKAPVSCSLCGKEEIMRDEMAVHTDANVGTCPKVVTPCPFSFVGCDFTDERWKVKEHALTQEALHSHVAFAAKVITEHGRVIQELQSKVATIARKTETMIPQVRENRQQQFQMARELRDRNVTGCLHWKVKVGTAVRHRKTSYCSPSFYTGCPGYKVHLTLDMDGHRVGNTRYVTLAITLLTGEYDDDVIFPLNATSRVTLLDQTSSVNRRVHLERDIVMREVPRNYSNSASQPSDRIHRREICRYMKIQDLVGHQSQYKKDGLLHFEVSVIHSYFPSPDYMQHTGDVGDLRGRGRRASLVQSSHASNSTQSTDGAPGLDPSTRQTIVAAYPPLNTIAQRDSVTHPATPPNFPPPFAQTTYTASRGRTSQRAVTGQGTVVAAEAHHIMGIAALAIIN